MGTGEFADNKYIVEHSCKWQQMMMQSINCCSVKNLSDTLWHRLCCSKMCFWHHSMQSKCVLHPVFTASTVNIAPWVLWHETRDYWHHDMQLTELKWACCGCAPWLCLCAIRIVACHYCSCMPLCGCVLLLLGVEYFHCVLHVMHIGTRPVSMPNCAKCSWLKMHA